MEQRQLGSLFPVSALTLGGGGVGQVWGETSREEAIETIRAAYAVGSRFSTWHRCTGAARPRT